MTIEGIDGMVIEKCSNTVVVAEPAKFNFSHAMIEMNFLKGLNRFNGNTAMKWSRSVLLRGIGHKGLGELWC